MKGSYQIYLCDKIGPQIVIWNGDSSQAYIYIDEVDVKVWDFQSGRIQILLAPPASYETLVLDVIFFFMKL